MKSVSTWALRYAFALGSLALPIVGVGCTGETGDCDDGVDNDDDGLIDCADTS